MEECSLVDPSQLVHFFFKAIHANNRYRLAWAWLGPRNCSIHLPKVVLIPVRYL
jgi:predicted transposase YdaD